MSEGQVSSAPPKRVGHAGRTYKPEVFSPKGLPNVKEFKFIHEDRMIGRFDVFLLVSLLFSTLYFLFIDRSHNVSKLFCTQLFILFIRIYFIQRKVKEESLLVSREWGVQVSTKYYFWSERRQFVHKDDVQSIIINEGFYSWKVIYYLAIIVKGNDKMVLPFEFTLPRLHDLLPVYHQARALMLADSETTEKEEDVQDDKATKHRKKEKQEKEH